MHDRLKIILVMKGGAEWIGGVEYIKNLVFALSSLPEAKSDDIEINLLANSGDSQQALQDMTPHLHRVYFAEEELAPFALLNRIKWKLARDVLNIQDRRRDEFFERHGFDFAYPHLGSSRSRVRSAAWISDFQHRMLKEYFSPEEIRARDLSFAAIAKNAPMVVLSSETAKQDFHRFFPNARGKSRVLSFRTVPQASWYQGNPESVRNKYNLPEKFILVSNQFWKHKNHLMIFEAVRQLKQKGLRPFLVCTGHLNDSRHPGYSSTVLQAIHAGGIADQVGLLGLIPRDDQIQLMRQAITLIQASLFEGWSSVVEDARCLGKSILLSDIPVHREQAPPHASYFDASTPMELMALLADVWTRGEPGPHRKQEQDALHQQELLVSDFARTFLSIAAQT